MPKRTQHVASQPTHRMQTRSRASQSPGAVFQQLPSTSNNSQKSRRYGSARPSSVETTAAAGRSLSAGLDEEESTVTDSLARHERLSSIQESEAEELHLSIENLNDVAGIAGEKSFDDPHEGGISDKASSKSEHGVSAFLTEEKILSIIKKQRQKNIYDFLGHLFLFASWLVSIIIVLSIAGLFVSSVGNPTASRALSAVTWPSRAIFNIPAPPSTPVHAEDCSRFIHDVEVWKEGKEVELNALRAGLHHQLETSRSDTADMRGKYNAFETELMKRLAEADKAAATCTKLNQELSQRFKSVEHDVSFLRAELHNLGRHHNLRKTYDLNLLSINMGAAIIPRLTSPTAQYGISFLRRFLHRSMVPRIPNPATAAISPWDEAGQCWCGSGSKISLGVALSQPAILGTFTIEHLPQDDKLDTSSQPRDFELWGRAIAGKQLRGETGCVTQKPTGKGWMCLLKSHFHPLTHTFTHHFDYDTRYAIDQVVFSTISNQGNPERTCVYRIKLSGDPRLEGLE